MAIDPDLSRAVEIYYNTSTVLSRLDHAKIRAQFGPHAHRLIKLLDALDEEMRHLPTKWDHESLGDATVRVIEHLRSRHPELSQEAATALGRSFSYDWK